MPSPFSRLCANAFFLCWSAASTGWTLAAEPPAPAAESVAGRLQRWIAQAGDNRALPYFILDKRQARMWIYDGSHRLIENSPVLLGSAAGDHSVPGIGTRPLADIAPQERTTPAGKFLLESGRNLAGEDIFWLDYDAAVSVHRVRTGKPGDRRLQRLATPSPADNRISYGCINVPTAVYNTSIHGPFAQRGGYAYVLPETQRPEEAFPFVPPQAWQAASPP